MGFVSVKVAVSALADGSRAAQIEFLVDTGAVYSLIPADQLIQLGIKPTSRKKFRQASGRSVSRQVGEARFRLGKSEGVSPVIFGRKHDKPLLGVVTLEVLGLAVDPVSQKLKPTPLLLLGTRE